MKYLVVHTYIPSEKCNQYPKEIDSVLCDDFKKALAIARKQLAAENLFGMISMLRCLTDSANVWITIKFRVRRMGICCICKIYKSR